MNFLSILKETGLSAGIQRAGDSMTLDTTFLIKASGSGLFTAWAVVAEGVGVTIIMATHFLWATYMVLGFGHAKMLGEETDLNKMFGGVWKLVAAWAVMVAGYSVEVVLYERALYWPVTITALSWIMIGFGIKTIQKADYFFPGFRRWIHTMLPNSWAARLPKEHLTEKEAARTVELAQQTVEAAAAVQRKITHNDP